MRQPPFRFPALFRRIALSLCASAALVTPLVTSGVAEAQSVIKRPGDHPEYSVEVEPHLLLLWDDRSEWDDEGFGPGVRINIPLMDNGPIQTINNNMAIGFGLDWAHFGDPCDDWRWWWRGRDAPPGSADCSANALWFPVVLQWNFWLTDIISVFGEPGFAIEHSWWEWDYCRDFPGDDCEYDDSDTDLEFVFWGGARFQFSDTVGATVRIGTPYLSAGVNFMF